MRITLDADACVGHGRCYALAPEVFDADDQGHGTIRPACADSVPPELHDTARLGADNCPEGAIAIDE